MRKVCPISLSKAIWDLFLPRMVDGEIVHSIPGKIYPWPTQTNISDHRNTASSIYQSVNYSVLHVTSIAATQSKFIFAQPSSPFHCEVKIGLHVLPVVLSVLPLVVSEHLLKEENTHFHNCLQTLRSLKPSSYKILIFLPKKKSTVSRDDSKSTVYNNLDYQKYPLASQLTVISILPSTVSVYSLLKKYFFE